MRVAFHRLAQTARALEPSAFPSITDTAGAWRTTPSSAWTSGFLPGSLWLAYAQTHRPVYRRWAQRWTSELAHQALVTSTHDIGFQLMSSFGNGYRLTHRTGYRTTLLTGARSLSSRYRPNVRAIRSWGRRNESEHFRVIVDGLMNLDLLWWAESHGGAHTLKMRAVSHTETTRRHFIRSDGSVRHLIDFAPESGDVLTVGNPQGYLPSSTWSRGQAWALNGFASAYRATGRRTFLIAARRTAGYYLSHVPADCIPYWDFNAPGIPDEPRDTSAAAIAADGLEQLAAIDPNRAHRVADRTSAAAILRSLTDRYVAPAGQAVLDGSTASFGVEPSDIGTAYGDYYFLHALVVWTVRHHRPAHPRQKPGWWTRLMSPSPSESSASPAKMSTVGAGFSSTAHSTRPSSSVDRAAAS